MQVLRKLSILSRPYWFLRKSYWRAKCKLGLTDYYQKFAIKKLQIGCSINVLPDWFNVDIIPFYDGSYFMDATREFPIPDETFDYVFSEHMIEHIDYLQGWHMLKECYRVLKPNGKIRIATPDLRKLVDLFREDKTDAQQEYIQSVMQTWRPEVNSDAEGYVVNVVFGFDHKFIYDEATLTIALQKAGFTNIKLMNPRESQFPELSHLDVHVGDYIEFETLVMEAEKA
jgi:predicted SAM-dependent methyltransferase